MTAAHDIKFEASGRGKAQCPPDPDYPKGKAVDATLFGETGCVIELPYPAEECGLWVVRCGACGMSCGITAAGRSDDPISVKISCNNRKPTNH